MPAIRGLSFLVALLVVGLSPSALGQAPHATPADLEVRVAALFARSCAIPGCHVGPAPQQGMSLHEGAFVEALVGKPSLERPDLLRVHPGRPDSSYLVMKIEGAEGIVGLPMPMTGDRLSADEIALIRAWIAGLSDDSGAQARPLREAYPFPGWKVVNLPTNRAVPTGALLVAIGHRFNPTVGAGYDAFFGLDGSSIILLGLGWALSDRVAFTLARSNADDDVELGARGTLTRQQHGGRPLSVGVVGTVNWFSEASGGVSRFRREAFKLSTQVILTRAFGDRAGAAVVPGILFNPSVDAEGEGPLVTLGLGGRIRVRGSLAVTAEWVPIVSGYARTTTFGNDNRFDSWAGGLEIATAGHVFQIVVANSVGLATDQYLRGGDLDLFEGDLRLGFNIFRLINL